MVQAPLVILHGANGCSEEMQPWRDALAAQFQVHLVNLAGHGGRSLPDLLSPGLMADDLLAQLDTLGLQRVLLLGYSFGGLLALRLASHHPERVAALVTVATKWVYDAESIRHLAHLVQVPRLTALAHRREHLQRVHQPNDWRLLVERLNAMFKSFAGAPPLGTDDLARIRCPALILSGSSDPLVSADETVALHRAIGGSDIALYRGPAHPADMIPVGGLQRAVAAWAARRLGARQDAPT